MWIIKCYLCSVLFCSYSQYHQLSWQCVDGEKLKAKTYFLTVLEILKRRKNQKSPLKLLKLIIELSFGGDNASSAHVEIILEFASTLCK